MPITATTVLPFALSVGVKVWTITFNRKGVKDLDHQHGRISFSLQEHWWCNAGIIGCDLLYCFSLCLHTPHTHHTHTEMSMWILPREIIRQFPIASHSQQTASTDGLLLTTKPPPMHSVSIPSDLHGVLNTANKNPAYYGEIVSVCVGGENGQQN